jgi:DNA repair protein RadC
MKTYKSNLRKLTLKEEKTEYKRVKITNSKEAYELIKQFFKDDLTIYESAFLILFNAANNTIGFVKISQGGINSTVMDAQIIAKYAVETLAKSVIIAHNHPSGNLNASESDKKVTEQIKNTLKIFDCNLADHLIITENGYFSFNDERIL